MSWEFVQPIRHADPAMPRERLTLDVTPAEVESARRLLEECAERNHLAGWTPAEYAESWLWIAALKSRAQPAALIQRAEEYAAEIDRLLGPTRETYAKRSLAKGQRGREAP
ncbi:MAG: hypothetical protein AAB409_06215 [Gemmatimonadota bacterium]